MVEMLSVYLAAPWKHRDEARVVRDRLIDAGFFVTSRWLDVDETQTAQADEAVNDLEDLQNSDAMLVLNCDQVSEGKAVEQGYMLAQSKPIVVVSRDAKPQNVFQHLECVTKVDSVSAAIAALQIIARVI